MILLLLQLLACGPAPSINPGGGPTSPPPATGAATQATQATPRAIAVQKITTADLAGMNPAPHVLDVRTPQEFADGHVPSAKNISIDQLDARIGELSAWKGQPIAVICAAGMRSDVGSKKLAAAGFSPVYDVTDGTDAWVTAGRPTERGYDE